MLNGTQQTIVPGHNQKPVQQAEAAQGVDLDLKRIVVDPDEIGREIDAGDLAAAPFGRPYRAQQGLDLGGQRGGTERADPANRLVASELEARWNKALARMAKVEGKIVVRRVSWTMQRGFGSTASYRACVKKNYLVLIQRRAEI